jgi:hypothetical protein
LGTTDEAHFLFPILGLFFLRGMKLHNKCSMQIVTDSRLG